MELQSMQIENCSEVSQRGTKLTTKSTMKSTKTTNLQQGYNNSGGSAVNGDGRYGGRRRRWPTSDDVNGAISNGVHHDRFIWHRQSPPGESQKSPNQEEVKKNERRRRRRWRRTGDVGTATAVAPSQQHVADGY